MGRNLVKCESVWSDAIKLTALPARAQTEGLERGSFPLTALGGLCPEASRVSVSSLL